MVKLQCFGAGGRSLYGQVQMQFRPALSGIVHDTGIGQDQCIDTGFGGLVHGPLPTFKTIGLRIGVDGDKDLAATLLGVAYRLVKGAIGEVQAGEMACVGVVLETDVDSVCAVINGGFQRWQIPCGAHQFHKRSSLWGIGKIF